MVVTNSPRSRITVASTGATDIVTNGCTVSTAGAVGVVSSLDAVRSTAICSRTDWFCVTTSGWAGSKVTVTPTVVMPVPDGLAADAERVCPLRLSHTSCVEVQSSVIDPEVYVPSGTAGASTSSVMVLRRARSTVSGVTSGVTIVPSLRVSVMASMLMM